MASLHPHNGGFKVRWRDRSGKQQGLWLGSIAVRKAEKIYPHVRELIESNLSGVLVDAATRKWVDNLEDDRLRSRLAKFGLIKTRPRRTNVQADTVLGPFLDRVIAEMVDSKPRTINNYRQTQKWLESHFGRDKLLDEITVADMARWKRHLRKSNLALSNRNKHVQRARSFFMSAVDDRILNESPARKLTQEKPPKGIRVDRSRQVFVDRVLTDDVLKGLPAGCVRLAFVMARYLGMRRCELYDATWADVDWERERIRIKSIKTGERHCPIFPDVMPYLREAFDEAPEGARRILADFHDVNSITPIVRKHVVNAIGESRTWPKILQQLRSTRRTELEELFPNHVVNEWLGHDSKTAEDHYLQVTPEHWQRAGQLAGNAGGNSCANLPSSTLNNDAEITADPDAEEAGSIVIATSIPPSRVELLFLD